jgi:hypothetical protein
MIFKPAVKLRCSGRPFIHADTSYNELVLIELLNEAFRKRLSKKTKVITCREELPSLPEGAIPNEDMLIFKPYFVKVGDLCRMYMDSHSGNSFKPESQKYL